MTEHGRLARAALEAGKHVLVEKPMATTLEEAERAARDGGGRARATSSARRTSCSRRPTGRCTRASARGEIGGLLPPAARYGWAGPDWGHWFYEPGGGALFDLGVYNVTSLCGFFGPARRVTAMTGIAIPERVVDGELIAGAGRRQRARADRLRRRALRRRHDRLHDAEVPLARRSSSTAPHGALQMLGDDWAPEGYELWRNDLGVWEVHPETDPTWPWTDGLRHLVECIETGHASRSTRPEHAYHVLEIMLAAQDAGADGRARDIELAFPAPDLRPARPPSTAHERVHDPRSAL